MVILLISLMIIKTICNPFFYKKMIVSFQYWFQEEYFVQINCQYKKIKWNIKFQLSYQFIKLRNS